MHKLEIKLKQHTPLIHFQHDQEGATLRASEVKPKLDRFILTRLGKGDYKAGVVQAKAKGWLVGKGEHPALNYKMRICVSAESRRKDFLLASYLNPAAIAGMKRDMIEAVSNTPYFAQERENGIIARSDDKRSEWNKIGKKGIMEDGALSLSITILKVKNGKELLNLIKDNIQSFFLATNFGTRQSKGFGSFTVTEIKVIGESVIELKGNDTLLKENFQFVYKKSIQVNGPNRIPKLFSTINNDYKVLKSGRTFPRPCVKSQMMLYAANKKMGWDKKYIKSLINNTIDNGLGQKYRLMGAKENIRLDIDCYYFRAMLGLAEQLEFLLANPPMGRNSNKMIVKIKNTDINRYQSPLIFKIINNDIYLVGNEVHPQMLNQLFDLTVTVQGDRRNNNISIGQIKTPSSFSLADFMRFAMNDNNLNYKKL